MPTTETVHTSDKAAIGLVLEALHQLCPTSQLWELNQWLLDPQSTIGPSDILGKIKIPVLYENVPEQELVFIVSLRLSEYKGKFEWHPTAISGYRHPYDNSVEYGALVDHTGALKEAIRYRNFPHKVAT